MKLMDLKPLTPYKITNGSSDGTIRNGDSIWISIDQSLCIAEALGGCLRKEEWTASSTCDFEAEPAHGYYIEKDRWKERLIKITK